MIDDDLSVQTLFDQFLRGAGYSVVLASNGIEGLRLIHKRKPDLIITDIIMPEMDGLEILQEVRQHNPDIPIIAISGGMRSLPMDFLPPAKKFGADHILKTGFADRPAKRYSTTARHIGPACIITQ